MLHENAPQPQADGQVVMSETDAGLVLLCPNATTITVLYGNFLTQLTHNEFAELHANILALEDPLPGSQEEAYEQLLLQTGASHMRLAFNWDELREFRHLVDRAASYLTLHAIMQDNEYGF